MQAAVCERQYFTYSTPTLPSLLEMQSSQNLLLLLGLALVCFSTALSQNILQERKRHIQIIAVYTQSTSKHNLKVTAK